jgi:hypothetical protein
MVSSNSDSSRGALPLPLPLSVNSGETGAGDRRSDDGGVSVPLDGGAERGLLRR